MSDESFWQSPIHRSFVESLNPEQLEALWDLLIVATCADERYSIEERRAIAAALAETPGFGGAEELVPRAVIADLERLGDAYRADAESLLSDIAYRLGSDAARRGAFRTAVQLVKTDGFTASEREFALRLGALLGLELEVIEFAVGT